MKSKEALETLFDLLCEREHTNSEHSFWLKLYQEAKKDLEVLEILKSRIHLTDSTLKAAHFTIDEKGLPHIDSDSKEVDVVFIESSGFVFKNSKEYELLKGWLEK